MKKIFAWRTAAAAAALFLVVSAACKKNQELQNETAAPAGTAAQKTVTGVQPVDENPLARTANCSSPFLSGSYGGFGYYRYPGRTLIFECRVSTITINCNSVEVPNRFTVYNANGVFVATTNWIGYANYSGLWGASLNGPGTRTISFHKNTTTCRLVVETGTNTQSDAWEVSASCTCIGG